MSLGAAPARWTVLGAGTASPHPLRSPSGHLLQTPAGAQVLVDLGAGTLWRLARAGVPWASLDAIFVTHRHLDHTLDLQSLMFAARIPGHGRTAPLPIYMGPGMLEFIHRLKHALDPWMEPRGFEAAWTELAPGAQVELADVRAQGVRVQHDATSLAYRFEVGGRVVAYSGDSDWCEGLVEVCHNADLAVLECSTSRRDKVAGHLSPREVAHVAREAGLARVVLVHTYPSLDGVELTSEVRACGYEGALWVAQDGDSFEV